MEKYGDIAQLGERLTGSQEVRGSSPLISTKREKRGNNILFFLFYFLCCIYYFLHILANHKLLIPFLLIFIF